MKLSKSFCLKSVIFSPASLGTMLTSGIDFLSNLRDEGDGPGSICHGMPQLCPATCDSLLTALSRHLRLSTNSLSRRLRLSTKSSVPPPAALQ